MTLTIRDYLCREARRITDRALSDYTDAETWRRLVPERRRQFIDMLGLSELPKQARAHPLNPTMTGVVERPGYRIEKLYYESLPKLYVAANLYLPNRTEASAPPYPGILYLCGHSQTQKVHYQAHARRFAELGFACLIVDTIQYGEVRGHHHGTYSQGWFHWFSRGYTPAGIEVLNAMRGLDLLSERADVDAERLGVTGTSGGGAQTWWTAACDARVNVAAASCATSTLTSHVTDRTVDEHCDCMWWTNTYGWDLADVGALIAPRPLMIASADRDAMNTIAAIREVYNQLKPLYTRLGVPNNVQLVEGAGPHAYTPNTRTAIFAWFARHLQGKDISPEEIGDLDASPESLESEETLRVFAKSALPNDRTPAIHEDTYTPPPMPQITDRESLKRTRQETVAALREKTFGAFPTDPPPLDVTCTFEFSWGSATGQRFAFTSEEGMRLHARFILPTAAAAPAPVVIALRSPGEARHATEEFVSEAPASWARVIGETRGTGDTAWGEELQWHLRRASAWSGRTIASMRVWDALRLLEAVRSLPQADAGKIGIAARGEMAVVALYAALLDGNVDTLFLESPPATQNEGSRPDGRGPAVEMLNCLRITDLPQVAGLLCPTNLVFKGDFPPAYAWAEELYRTLGESENFHHGNSWK